MSASLPAVTMVGGRAGGAESLGLGNCYAGWRSGCSKERKVSLQGDIEPRTGTTAGMDLAILTHVAYIIS